MDADDIVKQSYFYFESLSDLSTCFLAYHIPGHDLKEILAAKKLHKDVSVYYKDLFSRCTRLMKTIRKLPQPVIAQVHGVATAAGCQLVATCDLAIAADNARFGVNGINVGLFCSTPMVALSRNIPPKLAFEMLTTGKLINADRAFEFGLVNKIVPSEELNVETEALAETIASKLKSPLATGKHAFYEQLQMSLDEAYDYTGNVIVQNLLQDDTQECISVFVEKRSSRINQDDAKGHSSS